MLEVLLFSNLFAKLPRSFGDGVPLTTARTGMMTPTAQVQAVMESLFCNQEAAARRFFLTCAQTREIFLKEDSIMEHIFTIAALWLGLAVISAVIAYHLRISIALIEICVGVFTAAVAGYFG